MPFCAEQLAIICGKVFSFIFHFVCIKFPLIVHSVLIASHNCTHTHTPIHTYCILVHLPFSLSFSLTLSFTTCCAHNTIPYLLSIHLHPNRIEFNSITHNFHLELLFINQLLRIADLSRIPAFRTNTSSTR